MKQVGVQKTSSSGSYIHKSRLSHKKQNILQLMLILINILKTWEEVVITQQNEDRNFDC